MNFKLIIVMIKTNETDQIVTAAKAVGGTGATIIRPISSGGKSGGTGAGFNQPSRSLKGSRNGDCICDRRGTCRWTRKSTGALQAGGGKS